MYAIATSPTIANIAPNPGTADFGVGVAFSSAPGGAVGCAVGFGFPPALGVAAGFAVSPGANVGVGLGFGVSPGANVGVGAGVPSGASVSVDVTDHIQVCILDKRFSVFVAIAETFHVPATALVFV